MVINKETSAEPADHAQGNIGSWGDPKPLGGLPGKDCLQLLSPPDITVVQSSCFIREVILHTVMYTFGLIWCAFCVLAQPVVD